MPGIEDRLAKINAIKAEAEAKKAAEAEKTAKESVEKRTGLEQEKAQVEGELAQTNEELQKNESGLAEINAMDLSALDGESRAAIESEMVGIKEEMDNLSGKVAELTKRKQKIDEDIATLNNREEAVSAESPVETSTEGRISPKDTAPDKMEKKEESIENKLDQVIADADVIVDSFPIPNDWKQKIKDVLRTYLKNAKKDFKNITKYATKGTKYNTLDLAKNGNYRHEMLTSPAHEKIYKKYQSPTLSELAGMSSEEKRERERIRNNGLFNEEQDLKKTEQQFWGGSDELSKFNDMTEDVTSKVHDILNASIK